MNLLHRPGSVAVFCLMMLHHLTVGEPVTSGQHSDVQHLASSEHVTGGQHTETCMVGATFKCLPKLVLI